MILADLYLINNSWTKETTLYLRRNDGSLYKAAKPHQLEVRDYALKVVSFKDNTVIIED